MKQYRQGDLWIEAVAEIPSDAVKQKRTKKLILAHGEATGHHHALEADKADWWKRDEEVYFDIPAVREVTHQEHAPINLPPGKYRVRRQREYGPEAIRNVRD